MPNFNAVLSLCLKVNIINSSCGTALLITAVTKGPRHTELFCLTRSADVLQLMHMHQTKNVGMLGGFIQILRVEGVLCKHWSESHTKLCNKMKGCFVFFTMNLSIFSLNCQKIVKVVDQCFQKPSMEPSNVLFSTTQTYRNIMTENICTRTKKLITVAALE